MLHLITIFYANKWFEPLSDVTTVGLDAVFLLLHHIFSCCITQLDTQFNVLFEYLKIHNTPILCHRIY